MESSGWLDADDEDHVHEADERPMTDFFTDERRRCVACGGTFIWSAADQRAGGLRDWWPKKRSTDRHPPRRCPACRQVMKRIHGDRR
jgi:hypothetical protein